MQKIYCAYDQLTVPTDKDGNPIHQCGNYGTVLCAKCPSRFNGERIIKYIEDHPRGH